MPPSHGRDRRALRATLIASAAAPVSADRSCCRFVELRQYLLHPGQRDTLITLFVIEDSGARVLAQYETSTQPNNFPTLTIRTAERIFVWFARFSGADNYQTFRARLANSADWERRIWPTLRKRLTREPEVLRLSPTNRSRLRGEFAVTSGPSG